MSDDKKTDSLQPEEIRSTGSPPLSANHESRTDEADSSVAVESLSVKKPQGFFAERPLPAIEMTPGRLRYLTRRDVLLFGAGAVAALAGGGFLLPQETLSRLGVRRNKDSPGKEWFLNRALRIDDDVAEALYSENRRVPTYTKSQITPLKNNYNGATPDPGYISGWNLILDGLASGLSISLDIRNLTTRFSVHEQITRLVCVEGWSAVAWWAGLRFDDLLRAYPPMSQAKWARVESSVNLDDSGDPDPYFMSIDLATARHAQTLLATHFNGQPLTVDHGAPSIAEQCTSCNLIVPASKRRSSPCLLPKYRRYHRPIVWPLRFWCYCFVASDSIWYAQQEDFQKGIHNDSRKCSVHRQRPHHGSPGERYRPHRRWPSRH